MPRNTYPAPLVIPPLGEEHTHTVISLHGRGSNANLFGHVLLADASLQARLPTVKFVFPTASKRRATRFKKMPINQWFDNYSIDDPGERTDLQVEGLCETAELICDLISQEVHILGAGSHKKIILWGLSQGCAAGIFTLLGGWLDASKIRTIGAFVGMSGWLPFEQQLQEILRCGEIPTSARDNQEAQTDENSDSDSENEEAAMQRPNSDEELDTDAFSELDLDDDPFKRSSSAHDDFDPIADDEEEASLLDHAINHIRDILDLPMISSNDHSPEESQPQSGFHHLQTPVFLGHGSEDLKVSVELGRKMSHVLSAGLGMDVTWKAYEGLGHWYRVDDEIEDILRFLQDRVDLPVKQVPSQDRREEKGKDQ
ncbi:Phospholipase/carboxylesterase/thioesterase [Penicillium expansum]|uniref:Phospholipase/carboxylesterase/thioesterase n=1 Tax=Penicillium expansum TaxID=27334 RepID=A0A0A2J4N3_PENEN|nr:Phospholipase/carboxylesterase/thioesterase [Penicillium expansum]KGO37928.1 Phospholipase/carboxylesterase/thioesterase [Penicillium expansum]KGO49721.1 Phospholipase/carboxylesterase/thioesterase [Penicillium expansum]KGO72624.1 Phospholipase/carboxylesterase/thioesterase [Penicillium expansum]